MDHTITVEDIRDYLATKQEDEIIGEPMNGRACLSHNTLVHKYGMRDEHVDALSTHFEVRDEEGDWHSTDYPEDVEEVVDAFDMMGKHYVTKAEFRVRLPELFS